MSSSANPALPVIFGCAGPTLSGPERDFFARVRPHGFILFRRNVQDPPQLKALVAELRAAIGNPEAPVLIDQEGGPVARLRPPHWPEFPAARRIGELAEKDLMQGLEAARLCARLIAAELHDLGIDVDCAPVADLLMAGADPVIGERAYAADPDLAGKLAWAACKGFLEGGVLPVIKHIPGHGRAPVDSHKALPVVPTPAADLQATDFAPFMKLASMPWAMVAHVVYPAFDAAHAASVSPAIIGQVIRGQIGFDGVLIADDVGMEALSGDLGARARATIDAGCDLTLHCSGKLDEMRLVAAALPPLDAPRLSRLAAARKMLAPPRPFDRAAAAARLDQLLGRPPVQAKSPTWNSPVSKV